MTLKARRRRRIVLRLRRPDDPHDTATSSIHLHLIAAAVDGGGASRSRPAKTSQSFFISPILVDFRHPVTGSLMSYEQRAWLNAYRYVGLKKSRVKISDVSRSHDVVRK